MCFQYATKPFHHEFFLTLMQKTWIFRHFDYCKGSMVKTAYKTLFNMKTFVYLNAET